MTPKAQKIWDAFCGELIVEPTEDQAQALATAIRMIVDEYEYYEPYEDGFGAMVVSSLSLIELAGELEP